MRRHDLHAFGAFLAGTGAVALVTGAVMLAVGLVEDITLWKGVGGGTLGGGAAMLAGGIPVLVASYAMEPEIQFSDVPPVY